MPKIKNIIIFTSIAIILILGYVFFIKKAPEENNLTSSNGSSTETTTKTPTNTNNTANTTKSNTMGKDTLMENSTIAKNFLSLLLSVKSIKLDDAIFTNKVFINLRDSSILLTPSGDEGRLNPFAPIGYESATKKNIENTKSNESTDPTEPNLP